MWQRSSCHIWELGVGMVAVMQLSYPGVRGRVCGCEAAVISGSWG